MVMWTLDKISQFCVGGMGCPLYSKNDHVSLKTEQNIFQNFYKKSAKIIIVHHSKVLHEI